MTPFQSPTTKHHTIDRSRIQRPASTRLHLPSNQKPPDHTPPMNNAHPMPPPNRPQVLGIHHWKFAVSNLSLSLAWYERVLGAHRISSLDHFRNDGSRFAVICEMKDWAGVFLELRENAVKALDDRAWDPVTLAVRKRRDLEVWCRWLDACGTRHSAILTGMRGWLVVFEDPDGRRIRLYSQEDHGGKEKPSHDQQWLDDI